MTKPEAQIDPVAYVAVLCEKILVEKDEVVSIIRIVDNVIISIQPGGEPPYQIEAFAVVALRPGKSRGPHHVKLISRAPDGYTNDVAKEELVFPEGEISTFRLLAKINILLKLEGIYYIDVMINDTFAITMPYRVVFQTQQNLLQTTKLEPGQADRVTQATQ